MALFLRSSRNFIPNENERGSTMNEYPHLNHARHMWLFGGKCGTTAPFVAVKGKGNGHLSKREIEKGAAQGCREGGASTAVRLRRSPQESSQTCVVLHTKIP